VIRLRGEGLERKEEVAALWSQACLRSEPANCMLDEAEIEFELACLALITRRWAQPLAERTCLNDFASYNVVCSAANEGRGCTD